MNVKQRDAILQAWRARIVRESPHRPALMQVAARAFNDPDVRANSDIASQIESWVAERAAELAAEERSHEAEVDADTRPAPVEAAPTPPAAPVQTSAPQVRLTCQRLADEFRAHVAAFEEAGARDVLARIERLQKDSPEAITAEFTGGLASELRGLSERRRQVEAEIESQANSAAAAAAVGDESGVEQALRRLSSLRTMHPRLLTEARLEDIRLRIEEAGESYEHRQAARRLVARERAMAAEIKKLAETVHRFHRVARTIPHDAEQYRRAEAEYHLAVREVRSHDTEWLAGVILELTDLLAEAEDPTGEASEHLDRFVKSVRTALAQIRTEITQIETENRQT